MKNLLLITFGKLFSWTIQTFNLGNGSTWPGHIALKMNTHFIKQMIEKSSVTVILVAGTNGKTTTSSMITTVLESNKKTVLQNQSGANLLNGIASTIILNTTITGKIKADYAIFEIDENALPQVLKEVTPHYLLLLNLFRDQLDRYGEVHMIAGKWRSVLDKLSEKTTLILNADDPEIAYLGHNAKQSILYFGLDDASLHKSTGEHAADSTYCPQCGAKLIFNQRFFSHLGAWHCPNCELKRPQLTLSEFNPYPLSGTYNRYNTLAAVLTAKTIGLNEDHVQHALQDFKPAFGRQETVDVRGKKVQIFLAKNPTGFNESLRTVKELGATTILLVLNDRIADGTDVSWIWDIDIEIITSSVKHIIISGERAYDMGLLVKYATDRNAVFEIIPDLQHAIDISMNKTDTGQTLFILPTYTAMLDVRKIVTGKKIL